MKTFPEEEMFNGAVKVIIKEWIKSNDALL